MKQYTLIFCLLFVLVSFAQAQDITADQIRSDFAKWLPDMSADDSRLGDREAAQQGWRKYCMYAGAPGKADLKAVVNELMVEQLDQDVPVITKVWLLHNLAWTAGEKEIPAIVKLLNDPQIKIVDEATRALAAIPGDAAANALKSVSQNDPTKRIATALRNREPVSPNRSLEKTMPLAIPYVSNAELDKWMRGYAKLSNLDKASTIANLAVRKAKKYYPQIFDALQSDDEMLKRTAILALIQVGTKKQIPFLLKDGIAFDRGLGMKVLSNIVADGFDDALLGELKKESDWGQIALLTEVLSNRYYKKALPVIFTVAKKSDCPNRLDLLRSVGRMVDKSNVGDVIDVALLLTDRRQRDDAENIIAKICEKDIAPVVAKMNDATTAELLSLLGRIGGQDAVAEVEKHLVSKNAGIRNAAVRAISNWPNAEVAEKMMEIAKNADESEANRIGAIRGYIRVMTLPGNQLGITVSDEKRLEILKEIMGDSTTRRDEKILILERLPAIRTVESAKFVLEYLDDSALQANAAQSVVELAHHNDLRRPNKEFFTEALDKVIALAKEKDLKERGGEKRPLADVADWYKNNM
ncbi:MAG: hypothetical protein FWC43_00265 [Planctomycetaceae bacterium]|nr:hypothetical protein [Planctomycetaceae bacterium]